MSEVLCTNVWSPLHTHRVAAGRSGPGNLNVTIPGIDADQLIEQLPGLAFSTGSACSTGQSDPSHVLTAIGLDRPSARASIRIGLGRGTTLQDITIAAQQISAAGVMT